MRKFKRYVIRRMSDKKIVDTIVVRIGKPRPEVEEGFFIAEAIGYFEVEGERK